MAIVLDSIVLKHKSNGIASLLKILKCILITITIKSKSWGTAKTLCGSQSA